jgi:chromosomal replication initiator protein
MTVAVKEFEPQSGRAAQISHYAEVRNRIARLDAKPVATAAKTAASDALIIGELREENAGLKRDLARAQNSLRFVADRERRHREIDSRLQRLELDLADARARILTQAEMLRSIDDEGDEPVDHRRSVPEIVAEVLQDYPDVTWEDIKGIRRTRNLIAPRHACMKAVYEERKDLSLPRIGKIFHRDHSTILNSVHKTDAQRGEA